MKSWHNTNKQGFWFSSRTNISHQFGQPTKMSTALNIQQNMGKKSVAHINKQYQPPLFNKYNI